MDKITTKTCYIGSTKTKVPLVHVGTVFAKDIVIARANEVAFSDDYTKERWIWPDAIECGYDLAYFESLFSNVCIYTEKGHRYALVEGQHDEALDCRVYALAAFELVRMYAGKLPAVDVARAQQQQQPEPPCLEKPKKIERVEDIEPAESTGKGEIPQKVIKKRLRPL